MEKTKQPLSTFRLVAGIITIVLSVLVTFQSCAAGLSNALEENGESGGSAGVLLAVCFLVAGIVGIVTRKSTGAGGAFTSAGFYIVGGLIGLICAGSYADLVIWGVISQQSVSNPADLACIKQFPMAVASDGPANTGIPIALAVN